MSVLQSQEFTYVHPPILTSNDCEGAGEAFRVTTDALLSRGQNPQTTGPKDIPPTDTLSFPVPDYPEHFDRPTYLTVSSQLHLEALSAALSRVYTISPTFRAERSKTHRHLSEFSMLEAEIAFCDDLEDIMSVVERSIKDVFRTLRTHAFPEVGFFRDFRTKYGDKQVDIEFRAGEGPVSTEVAGSEHDLLRMMDDLSSPGVRWARMTHAEAVKELQQYQDRHPGAFVYPIGPRLPLQSEHEKWLAGNLIDGPVFITDYPASLKPFYMRENDRGRLHWTEGEPTVACFDLLVPRVGELVGGSLREERLDRLLQAMRARNMRTEDMQWYLDLRRFGTFPHGGFGMGFERFISWVTGLENIRDCVPFPRSIGRIAL
jgi:asparaginyl-tRNA synthetase